mgnify:CR=1 FL=1
MDKIVFIELTGYYATSNNFADTLDCEKCLEEAKEKAENLGLSSERFEEACEEICGDDLEEVDTSDLKKEKILSMINNTIENKNKQYNKISLNYDEKTKLNILSFEKELSQRELFKKNLIEKQKNRGKTLSSNVDKRWELYEKIKSMPQMKNIPNNISVELFVFYVARVNKL